MLEINTASEDDLLLLPGLNLEQAQAIMAYKQHQGGFASLEAFLDFLPGLGVPPHAYEAIRTRVQVQASAKHTVRILDI